MSNYLMIPSPTVKSDLKTDNKYLVYIPIATRETYGSVKIGDGLLIDGGVISFDENKLPILSILKNGIKIEPDENKRINITLNKTDVGLHNVDNTSDKNKPVSTLQQLEFDKKVNIAQGVEHEGKFLFVDSSGNVGLTSSGGSISTKYKDSLLTNETKIYNFTDAFVLSLNGNEIKIDASDELKSAFKLIEYDGKTGVLSFIKYDGSVMSVDLPLELIAKSGYYDQITQELVLVLTNDDEIRIPVGDLIDQYYADETTLTLKEINGKLTFSLKEGLLDEYVPVKGTQILDAKVFNDEIAILNTSDNTIDRIKHINNNFLISASDGSNLLNIDTQLKTISAFNKQIAFKEDITAGSIDPAENDKLGSMQGNYSATEYDSPNENSPELMYNVVHGMMNKQYHLVNNGVGLIYLTVPEIYSYFRTALGDIDSILDAINGEVV